MTPVLAQSAVRVSDAERRKQAGASGVALVRRRSSDRFHVLDESLFRDALVREQRRADRFEQPFALVLMSLPPGTHESRSSAMLDALAAGRSETDIIGWFQQAKVLGLIAHVAQNANEAAVNLGQTVQRELVRSLSGDAISGCSIKLDVYSPQAGFVSALPGYAPNDYGDARHAIRRLTKRFIDILGSLILLALSSPLLAIVAALVKWTSKGPVLYRHERVGQHGVPFTMFKFRTMRFGAGDEIHHQYVSQFIHAKLTPESVSKAVFKIVNDPRVTSVGRFLRRSSLDELPQLWNVLKGEMSLVGPRPPLSYEVRCYKRWHQRRLLEAKPGITGLWQVTGRGRTTFDEMVRLDIRYAKSHSIWTDLKILFATPRAVISGNGAH